MGQAITTLFRRLFLFDEETTGSSGVGLFHLYWRMVKAILQLLKQLVVRLAGKPPSKDPISSSCIAKDQQRVVPESSASSSTISEIEICSVAESGDNPPPRLGPYSGQDRILLVGEGDFSFSASIAVAFGDAFNLIATSLDSPEYLRENYKRAEANITALTSRGCKVIHGVDATTMANHPQLHTLKFDFIVFNFPFATFTERNPPRAAQISKNQELAKGFLANAKKMIESDGQIHITHQCFGQFLEWKIEMLGSSEGLRLVEETPFCSRDYHGYCAKFGRGGDASFGCNPSKTYKFQLANPPKKKKRTRRKCTKEVQVVC